MSSPLSTPVRLPVPSCNFQYKVVSETGDAVETQMVPIPQDVINVPGRKSQAKCELLFISGDIAPLSYSVFHVRLTSTPVTMTGFKPIMSSITMENSQIKLLFSDKGTLIKVNMDNSEIHLSQEFAFYEGAVGNNSRLV